MRNRNQYLLEMIISISNEKIFWARGNSSLKLVNPYDFNIFAHHFNDNNKLKWVNDVHVIYFRCECDAIHHPALNCIIISHEMQCNKMRSSLYLFMTNLMSHILSSWMSTCKLEILFYLFQCFGYFVNVRGRTWVWHIENSKYILKLLLWYPTNRTHPHHLLVCWLTDCQTKWLARLVD